MKCTIKKSKLQNTTQQYLLQKLRLWNCISDLVYTVKQFYEEIGWYGFPSIL